MQVIEEAVGQLGLFGALPAPLAEATILEVDASVRWWEDGKLNGRDDTPGGMPFRSGERWQPYIDLATGAVLDWPRGVTASVNYKTTDEGRYWLLKADNERIAKWNGGYVPVKILRTRGQDEDYITFDIDANGHIPGWKPPKLVHAEWTLL
jgi:hypothetical protein